MEMLTAEMPKHYESRVNQRLLRYTTKSVSKSKVSTVQFPSCYFSIVLFVCFLVNVIRSVVALRLIRFSFVLHKEKCPIYVESVIHLRPDSGS